MSDYDLNKLNDKEFEILCVDLLSEVLKTRVERFKPGKDAGVDGRFFNADGHEVIIQCKHWAKSSLNSVIREIIKEELPKLNKINPSRYILMLSHELSRLNKAKIRQSMHPFILSETDIYGAEDLVDIIKRHPQIEKRHYKIWIQNSKIIINMLHNGVIGRSKFKVDDIVSKSVYYALTDNHEKAYNILEKNGVAIITGEPGVGKTTLAEQLCIFYISLGFELVHISQNIQEGESVFDSEEKQIFYFDDFLGSNYLDALNGHEGSQICNFIKRIERSKNKKFILTSRSTILNKGKTLISSITQSNIIKNEFEIKINSLTSIDKARILYNHIWHSGLGDEYIKQIYLNKRYKNVINDSNFNPRLISYVTDPHRIKSISSNEYWEYILKSLGNPIDIWEHPFIAQTDDFGRALIIMVSLNGKLIEEGVLAKAYNIYISLTENMSFAGERDFQTNIKFLAGSMLTRNVISDDIVMLGVFNPSIIDFIIHRYIRDESLLFNIITSLSSDLSLQSFISLGDSSTSRRNAIDSVMQRILIDCCNKNFEKNTPSYVSKLCWFFYGKKSECMLKYYNKALDFICSSAFNGDLEQPLIMLESSVDYKLISQSLVMGFLEKNISQVKDIRSAEIFLKLTSELFKSRSEQDELLSQLKIHLTEYFSEHIYDLIDPADIYQRTYPEDYREARSCLKSEVQDRLSSIGLFLDDDFCDSIIDSIDINAELDEFHSERSNYRYDDHRVRESNSVNQFDEVDDLFSRDGMIFNLE